MNKNIQRPKKHLARLLKLLMKAPTDGLVATFHSSKVTIHFQNREYSFSKELCEENLVNDTIRMIGKNLGITDVGIVVARQLLHPEHEFQTPLESRGSKSASPDDTPGSKSDRIVKNLSESPLMRLYSRKNKDGRGYITSEELAAGEKLRLDFEKANLQPSVTANWDRIGIGKGGNHPSNPHTDISDFAIDNRKYVERAIEHLGPELSGIALDICCFLKGLELVERERRWPPRSAKLMLKTALGILARYYGFLQTSQRAFGKIEHWGEDNFRPNIKTA